MVERVENVLLRTRRSAENEVIRLKLFNQIGQIMRFVLCNIE